jgi:hypothetical protein
MTKTGIGLALACLVALPSASYGKPHYLTSDDEPWPFGLNDGVYRNPIYRLTPQIPHLQPYAVLKDEKCPNDGSGPERLDCAGRWGH